MADYLTTGQLTGVDESLLVEAAPGQRLLGQVASAFHALQADAKAAGFELAIASGFRSYDRQLAIWNGKAGGDRPVFDDAGQVVPMASLPPAEQVHAIMRYSALPGGSRHHWGTDLDVYDAGAIDAAYQVQLSPEEVATGGVFAPLHDWLDERMAAGKSRGFFRPYAIDRGGVAPERWHLSFAPVAAPCAGRVSAGVLRDCWQAAEQRPLLLSEIKQDLPRLVARYVEVAGGWCPGE